VNPPVDGTQSGLIEHMHRAVVHGLGAVTGYATMLSAEVERRGRRLLNQALAVFVLAGIGIAGLVLFALGAAQWIESRITEPGSGAMIVGFCMVTVFLAVALTRALRKERRT